MTKILAICGSLRSGSVNAATMRAALANAPDGVSFSTFDAADIPLFNGDVEDAGTPEPVAALIAAVEAADGVLFFTPEYNGSYPAVTKNMIDWLSRPPHPWTGKGMTLVVTTPGKMAGEFLRTHFDGVFGSGFFPIKHHPAHGIGNYGEILGDDGEVTDQATIDGLTAYVAAFAEAISPE